MRDFNAAQYIQLVEQTNLVELESFMKDELKMILSINDLHKKSLYDLGAGHGRILSHVISYVKKFIGIEIND